MSETPSVRTVLLPNVELNMELVTVTNVFVKPGDAVTKGQALGAVETQKANIEIESPYGGFVHEIFISESQEIGEKAPVCTIGEHPPSAPAAAVPAAPAVIVSAVPPQSPVASPVPAPPPAAEGKVRASPVARKVAASLGLDLRQITGTGPAGRIKRCDVEEFQAQASVPVPPPAAAASRPPLQVSTGGDWQAFPVSRAGLIGQMETAARTIPMFSISRQFDVTPLSRKQPGITFTHRLILCLGRALAAHRSLLTSIDGGRYRMEEVSVAVAMDTASGLLAPVVRNPQALTLPEIAATVQLLKARADAGQLKRADLERAPFAISNLGMFGVDVFQPSVFAGQSAVLGSGRAVDAAGGRKTAWFTLACDHRAVDGAEAARFFQTLQQEIDAQ
jgi:pyruvate dehydrogenase E2 component (dihydrolipoamide acetyltransferase)